MRLLLDTSVLIRWFAADPRLTPRASHLISDTRHSVAVSAVSLWEVAIKSALGKLRIDVDALCEEIRRFGFQETPFTFAHAAAVLKLPALHRDPFDRALVAQCLVEGLHLVTTDAILARYANTTLIV